MGFLSSLTQLKITHRLAGGFAILVLLLVAAVSITVWEVSGIKSQTDRIVNLRMPTAQASAKMTNNINASLASLRGYMLTGNKVFKIERAAVWDDIAKVEVNLNKLSQNWTNPANVKKLQGFMTTLAEFKLAQEKVEKIAHSKDEQPATIILVNEAAPRAKIILASITKMIDLELQAAANSGNAGADRIKLLGYMADFRGSFAVGLANIRAFLLTGNQKFENNFNTLWAKNSKRFTSLVQSSALLQPGQRAALKKLSKERSGFAALPPRMFKIRGSKKWNMANYLLVKEAAPRAGKLLTTLNGPKNADGSRNAGMVANQLRLLRADATAGAVKTQQLQMVEWILLAVGILAGALVAFFTIRAIAKPIVSMTEAMKSLADNNLDVEIPAQGRSDEIGDMSSAVQVFKENAIEVKRLAEQQGASERKAAEERKSLMDKMANDFESSVGGVVENVATAASQMQSSAGSMSKLADDAKTKSMAVASSSEEAATNVQTVASAAEELSSSIHEIGRQVSRSSEIAEQAVENAKDADIQIRNLAETANKIGDVVRLITDIADQTNLLALNATIEAARAGDAGKGFAVVASEVKSLASQTAKATEEIDSQIDAIQKATQGSVDAITKIGSTIGEINEISSGIAAAVEEQGAATQEIARNVEQAASGTQEVTSNISSVSQAAGETGDAANEIGGAASKLSEQSDHLQTEVKKFLQTVRAA